MEPQLLFVLGAPKSATTTLMGILNCHDDVVIFHEILNIVSSRLDRKMHAKRYSNLVKINKQFKEIVAGRKHIDKKLALFRNRVNSMREYKYIGFKFADIQWLKREQTYNKHKIIYIVRDIRTWLGKSHIAGKKHKVRKSMTWLKRSAIGYINSFLGSFLLEDCLIIRMEDLIKDNESVIRKMADFLELDPEPMYNWWDKIGKWQDPLKTYEEWWNKHVSSVVKPKEFDVEVDMAENEFWDGLLEVFDKYYNNTSGSFSKNEIKKDLDSLKEIKTTKFVDLYNNIKETAVKPKQDVEQCLDEE